MKRFARCAVSILLLFSIKILFAAHYSLPKDYDPKTSDLQFNELSDNTYDVYLNIPSRHIPKTWIYHSKQGEFYGAGDIYLTSELIGAVFSYVDDKKFQEDIVYFNVKNYETSTVYHFSDQILYSKNVTAHPIR